MTEITHFALLVVRGHFIVILLHQLTLGRLLSQQSLNKVDLLVEQLKLSPFRITLHVLDYLNEIYQFLVDVLFHDVYYR